MDTPMHALKFKAHIDSSRRIQIQLPLDAPEGDAEVIVLIAKPPATKEAGLRAFFDNLDRHPPQRRYSTEEIEANLAKERADWN